MKFSSARTSLDRNSLLNNSSIRSIPYVPVLTESPSRSHLQEINRKLVNMLDRGEPLKKMALKAADQEKEFIVSKLKKYSVRGDESDDEDRQ